MRSHEDEGVVTVSMNEIVRIIPHCQKALALQAASVSKLGDLCRPLGSPDPRIH